MNVYYVGNAPVQAPVPLPILIPSFSASSSFFILLLPPSSFPPPSSFLLPLFCIPCISSSFFFKGGPSSGRVLSLIHISEPTRLLSISYAVFCLKKKKN